MSDAKVPLLVAAPGMTTGEVAAASTAKVTMPLPDDANGLIQPHGPHRVEIRHPAHVFALPPGEYAVVDVFKGIVYRVTATPQLDYLDIPRTIDLLKLLTDEFAKAAWQPIETPIFDALPKGLPTINAAVLGEWKNETWTAEMRVKQALDAGSDEAKMIGFHDGAYLTTLIVWDEKLLPP